MSNLKSEGFIGIPFGSTSKIAKKIISEREGSFFDDENSTLDSLIFDNVLFAGRKSEFLILKFYQDQFVKSAIYFKSKLDIRVVELYNEIKDEINSI